jgi:hypothetical protein
MFVPSYVWALILTGAIGIRALVSVGLYHAALAAGLARRTATTVAVGAAVLLVGWLAGSALLAYGGVYRSGPWSPAVVVGVLVALLASTRIPVLARVLAAPGVAAHLAWPQTVRVVGVVLLIMMFMGQLPALFAVPAGLGDLAVGLAAPWVARALARDTGHRRAVRFNVLGIVDLVVALGTGMLSGLVLAGPSDAALGTLPLALIPTTAVPLAAALHIVSLRRLTSTPADTPAGTPPQPGMAAASR